MAICPSNPRSRTPVTIRSCASDGVSAWPNEAGSLRIVRTLAMFLCFFGVPATGDEPIGRTFDLTSQVASAEKHLEAGELRKAAEQLRAADEQVKSDEIGEPSLDLTIPLARLAHACQADGNLEMAVEFYGRSVAASTRPAAGSLSASRVNLVRMAAAQMMFRQRAFDSALDSIALVLGSTDDSAVTESRTAQQQRDFSVRICLEIGSAALSDGDHDRASRAYQLAASHAPMSDKPTALLGHAWATALAGDRPLAAARKLASFVEQFPDHEDAPRAARACAACLTKAGREEDASVMLADLLHRWPRSDSAIQVVVNQPEGVDDGTNIAESVRAWLTSEVASEMVEALDAKTVRLALLLAARKNDVPGWNAFARRLAESDDRGQATADAFESLIHSGLEADADRLAALFISPPEGLEITPRARESACRWAGRTKRWSMLALASESESPERASASRTPSVERLFAEALIQTGRGAESRVWWNHLVELPETDDFATLLRCAEAETAHGSDIELAAKRIEAARVAAGEDSFRVSLTDLLRAELAIRQLDFDHARGLLEKVVRATATDRAVRARAQWLIGETHYLQQDFPAAIEAYRKVEGIDPAGGWVSASLIQAGKSFEQLGRTREAAVCYLGLLNRFGDTVHASLARRRLAAISPETSSPTQNTNSTIRR